MKDPKFKFVIYFVFVASGISGLMYQVVWLRMLTRMLGVTIYATSTVIAAFMAGLALGSFIMGRLIDRRDDPLRVYALLEFLIGVTAALVPIIFSVSIPLYVYVYQATGESDAAIAVFRIVFSFLLLMVPTTMMGGTLPVLTSWLTKREKIFGKSFSLLYGLNTLGAVLGVFISGFITIGAFGEQVTIFIGVLVNLFVAVVAYFIYMRDRQSGEKIPHTESQAKALDQAVSPYPDYIRRIVLIAFTISGFTALAYEVIWTRQLILFLRTSTYAFSGMLTIFLLGISLGSLFMNKFVDRLKNPLVVFGLLELAVGLLSIMNLYLFAPLDHRFMEKLFGLSSSVLAAVIIVFPLTFIFGMIFPIAGLSYAKTLRKAGSSVGVLYGFNTLGSILGSLIAGFLLIPFLGSTKAVIILAFFKCCFGIGTLLS